MPDPFTAPDPVFNCPQCSHYLPPGTLACPDCHALIYTLHVGHIAKAAQSLELQSVSLRDLLAWAEATTYVAKLVARQYAGHTLAEAVDVLVQDLVRAGAARLGGTQLHNA